MSNISLIKRDEKSIALKYVLAILNSQLIAYYFVKNTAKSVRKMFPKIILNDLRKFPIKDISEEKQQPFVAKVNLILLMNEDLQEVSSKFQKSLFRKFDGLDKLSKKLEKWQELSYSDFIKELKKKKITLSLSEEADWQDYFEENKQKAQALQTQIAQTDKEIDAMVHELYGLTEGEIKIVENS